MRLARINIIDANSSQAIFGHNDLAAYHAILGAMHQPPSELHLLWSQFLGGWDHEPMCCIPHTSEYDVTYSPNTFTHSISLQNVSTN